MGVSYASYSYLDVSVDDDGIALIVFNRPEKMNACGREDHKELATILRDINRDPDVKVALVAANGPGFSVGGDLSLVEEMSTSLSTAIGLMQEAREIVQSHIDLEKPVVCAIQGAAMGSGVIFALLCDYIIMERQALVADGHIRAALAAGDGGALIWPLAMGLTRAKKYLLTGDFISAEDAERFGLVTEIVEEGESRERALAVARRLAAGPQLAIRATKMALNQWLRLAQITSYDYSVALEFLAARHEDVPKALADLAQGGVGAMPRESRKSNQ